MRVRSRLGLVPVAVAAIAVAVVVLTRRAGPPYHEEPSANGASEGGPQRVEETRGVSLATASRASRPETASASDAPSSVPASLAASAIGRPLRGVVTDDLGEPVPGATVSAEPWDGDRRQISTTTDARGRFEAVGPAGAELFVLSVGAADHGESLRFLDATEGDLSIRLPRLSRATLRLRLEGVIPPDSTEVLVELGVPGHPEQGAATLLPIQRNELLVRAKDRVPGRLLPGAVTVSIRGPEVLGGPVAVVLPASDETVDAAVVLHRSEGGRVRGTVRDEKGAVVAGAQVWPTWGPDAGGFPFPWQRPVSDAEGRFVLTDLPPGVVELHASAPGQGMAASSPEGRVVAPVGADDVRIVLFREVEVKGLLGTGGEEAARRLSLRWRPASDSSAAPSSLPFRSSFTIRLRPGTWELWAYDRPVEGAHLVVEVTPGAPVSGVVLPLPPVPARIRGRVLAPDGAPAPGVPVDLPDLRDARTEFAPLGSTDREGRFDVPTRPGSRVRLVAAREGEVGELLDVPADGEPVVVRLVPRGSCRVSGRVLVPIDAASPPSVLVALSPDGARALDCGFLLEDGGFGGELPAGPWRLSATVGDLVVWPPVDVEARDGTTLRGLRLALVPGATIEGAVHAADGQPVVGAFVRVEPEARAEGPLSSRPVVRTSDDGRFRHAGLVPGRWRVRASRADWPGPVEARVDVRLGDPAQVSLLAPR